MTNLYFAIFKSVVITIVDKPYKTNGADKICIPGQAYLGSEFRRLLGSLHVNPNRMTPLQLLDTSRNFT